MTSTIENSMNWIKLVALAISVTSSFILYSQTEDEPSRINEFWTGTTLKYKLNKKVSFSLDNQVRVTDNLTTIRSTFFEFGAKYKFNKHFSTNLNYRYTIRNQQRHVNRLTLDGNAKWKLKPSRVELSYRFRLQHGIVTYTKEPSTYLRNRFQISYELLKDLRLFAHYESFYRLNGKSEFQQNLFAAGIEFELNKHTELSMYYRVDQEINKKHPEVLHIIAVMASFDL